MTPKATSLLSQLTSSSEQQTYLVLWLLGEERENLRGGFTRVAVKGASCKLWLHLGLSPCKSRACLFFLTQSSWTHALCLCFIYEADPFKKKSNYIGSQNVQAIQHLSLASSLPLPA